MTVGGNLSVAGTSSAFNDLIRYSDAGTITLESVTGDVMLAAGSTVSVAAASGGGNAGTLNVRARQRRRLPTPEASLGTADGRDSTGRFLLDVRNVRRYPVPVRSLQSARASGCGRILRLPQLSASATEMSSIDHSIAATSSPSPRIREAFSSPGNRCFRRNRRCHLAGRPRQSDPGCRVPNSASLRSTSTARARAAPSCWKPEPSATAWPITSALLDLQAGAEHRSRRERICRRGVTPRRAPAPSRANSPAPCICARRGPRPTTISGSDSIQSTIIGASSVVAEGFKVYTPAGGVLNIAQRNLINTDATASSVPPGSAMPTKPPCAANFSLELPMPPAWTRCWSSPPAWKSSTRPAISHSALPTTPAPAPPTPKPWPPPTGIYPDSATAAAAPRAC